MQKLTDITPTMGRGSNAYVTGKLAYVSNGNGGGARVHVRYIGQYEREGVLWDAWTPSGWTLAVWIRLDGVAGKRARFIYDPGDHTKRLIEHANRPY
jgi:hypothetical protein